MAGRHTAAQRRTRAPLLDALRTAAIALALLLLAASGQATPPTDQEQHLIYELNRARHDPSGWAVEQGLPARIGGDSQPTTLAGVAPRPPLALNALLLESARAHSIDMATHNYFAHVSSGGVWANDRVRSTGYLLRGSVPRAAGGIWTLPAGFNSIEAIAAGCCNGSSDLSQGLNALTVLIVDDQVPSLSHRIHLLGMDDFYMHFKEVGSGFGASGSAAFTNYWTVHTGLVELADAFLTGVVYDDFDQDGLYDPGEGLGGVTVGVVGGDSVQTHASGGWSLAVDDGSWRVGCSGGSFVGAAQVQVDVAGLNRQVDCISGEPGARIDFVPVPEPRPAAAGLVALGALAAAARRRPAFCSDR